MADYKIGSTQLQEDIVIEKPPRKPLSRRAKIAISVSLVVFITVVLPISAMATYILIPLRGEKTGYNWTPESDFNALRGVAGHELRIPEDRDLRVLMLADLHISLFGSPRTFRMMDYLVALTEPDLIVLMGDNVGFFWNNLSMNQLVRHMDGYGIPWAAIIGNHDERGKADRNYIAGQLGNTENGLFLFGPNSLYRVSGNYFINLVNRYNNIAHTLYLMGCEIQYGVSQNYRAIPQGQIDWFRWVKAGNPDVESTIMKHIPLREFHNAWYYGEHVFGYKRDSMHRPTRSRVHAPECTADFFNAIQETGRVRNFFSGHDHSNNYSSIYNGLQMTYVLYSSWSMISEVYWNMRPLPRGGTLLTVGHDGSTRQRHVVATAIRQTPSLPVTTREELAIWLNAGLQ
ncbi:MAG: metallophosphoesterase [Firmicutes bacterium]|nr:metallophosphoesterase [Bacillota bacterium]